MTRKLCERCENADAVYREKFCKGCRKKVLAELKAVGYLSDPVKTATFSDARGRNSRSPQVLGGSAEMLDDGDD